MLAALTSRFNAWRAAGRQLPLRWWLVLIFAGAALALLAGFVLWQTQRRAAAEFSAGAFGRELAAAQTELHTLEIVTRLELLRSFLEARRTHTEVEAFFEAISRTAERTYQAVDPRWEEIEGKLTTLGLEIAESDSGAVATISDLIATLVP